MKLSSLANQAFAAYKQAEVDEQAAGGSLYKASKFISLCCAALVAFGLLQSSGLVNFRPEQTASHPEVARGNKQAERETPGATISSIDKQDRKPPVDLKSQVMTTLSLLNFQPLNKFRKYQRSI